MGLESVSFIDDLVITNPVTSDPRNEGDDHIRNIKKAILATFPNITAAVTPTHTELNYVDGVTSSIQTQLDSKGAGGDDIPATTHMLFFQASAPVGWSQTTAHNDKAFRVVSGTGGGNGGSVAFETAFASKSVSGTTDSHVLVLAETPAHSHQVQFGGLAGGLKGFGRGSSNSGNYSTENSGGGGGHTHGFSANAIDLDVSYINIITCTKD